MPKCRYSVTAPPAVIVRFHSFAGPYLRGQRGGWLNAVYGSLSYRARTARRAHKRIGTNHRRRRISIIIEHVLKNTRRRRLQDARVLRDLTTTNSHTVPTSKRSSYHDEAYVCALRPENWSNILTGWVIRGSQTFTAPLAKSLLCRNPNGFYTTYKIMRNSVYLYNIWNAICRIVHVYTFLRKSAKSARFAGLYFTGNVVVLVHQSYSWTVNTYDQSNRVIRFKSESTRPFRRNLRSYKIVTLGNPKYSVPEYFLKIFSSRSS